MTLEPDEIKRRISGARILRGMDQKELERRGAAEGYGAVELGRLERGEIPYRPGKHLDVLCRILNVPRWWFTAETLHFGGIDAPASPDEVASLLAQQNDLLARQSRILANIEAAIDREDEAAAKRDAESARRLDEGVQRALRALSADLPSTAEVHERQAK